MDGPHTLEPKAAARMLEPRWGELVKAMCPAPGRPISQAIHSSPQAFEVRAPRPACTQLSQGHVGLGSRLALRPPLACWPSRADSSHPHVHSVMAASVQLAEAPLLQDHVLPRTFPISLSNSLELSESVRQFGENRHPSHAHTLHLFRATLLHTDVAQLSCNASTSVSEA